MKSKLLVLFLFCLAIAGGYRLYKFTHDFRVDYISSRIQYHPEWDIKGLPPSSEIRSLFNKPFRYLGKGGQAYAFESEDGKYVLKFVKFKFLEPRLKHRLVSFIPFFEDWNANEMERRYRKCHDLFLGYKCAYEVNQKNSGIVYLHFNPTFNQFGSAELIDRKGLKHVVDLDQTVFIIQQKSDMLNELLAELLNRGDIEEAKNRIAKILAMYVAHYKMGLHDLGYGIIHNTGFVNDTPIHVDLGKMTWDEEIIKPEAYKPDLLINVSKINDWVKKSYPNHHAEISLFLERELNQIFL